VIWVARAPGAGPPFHQQGRGLDHQRRHLVDLPVTGHASDALPDINLIVETDDVGQVVDPHPVGRPALAEARARRHEDRRIG
jgi:hypothetical protein